MKKLAILFVLCVLAGVSIASACDACGSPFKAELFAVATVPNPEPAPKMLFVQDPAPAPAGWSGAFYYDLRSRQTSAVVMRPVTSFQNVLGTRLAVDLSAFAGVGLSDQAPLIGFALTKSFPLADRVSAAFGAGWTASQGKPTGLGVIASLSVRF
jgi:hypothetical protein